jgi:hypothetical protein
MSEHASIRASSSNVAVCQMVGIFSSPLILRAQKPTSQSTADNSNVRPPVTSRDLEIVKRARQILDSASKWNRADNRECPKEAKTFSLYCALQMATNEVAGQPDHRGAALQETRFGKKEIRLDLYTAAHSENALVRKFVDFAQSKAGQDIVGTREMVKMFLHLAK